VDTGHAIRLRDRAILATLVYTAFRDGAVAKLRLGESSTTAVRACCGTRRRAARAEKPLRHYLEGFIADRLDAAGIAAEAQGSPLFRGAMDARSG
jgi:integrase/recombinase XerD